MLRVSALVLALVLLLALEAREALASDAGTASKRNALVGTVVDKDGPMPGATVELTGSGLGRPLVTTTDAEGKYRFEGLQPGTYQVRSSIDGVTWSLSEEIQVQSGNNQVPPLSLLLEQITVTSAEERAVKMESAAKGETFKAEQLANLPVNRDVKEVTKIAAGVTEDQGSGGQSVYGSSGLESAYLLDGQNVTSVESGRSAKQINFDIIDRINLKTTGYEAEFGGAQGGVIEVQTKSGGNSFSGSLGGYLTSPSFTPNTKVSALGTQQAKPENREFSGTLGGYIIPDKLFFFAAVSRRNENLAAPQRPFAINFPAGGQWEVYRRKTAESLDQQDLYFLKLSWQASTNSRFTLSLIADPRNQMVADALSGSGGDHNVATGGRNFSLSFTRLFSERWFFEAQVGLHNERFDLSPISREVLGADRATSRPTVRARTSFDSQIPGDPSELFGPYGYSGNTQSDRKSAKASLDYLVGGHSIKAGIGVDRGHFKQSLMYGWGTGMVNEWFPIDSRTALIGVRRCWGNGRGNCRGWGDQVHPEAENSTITGFLQDRWTIGRDLTVNLGLRWERQSIEDSTGKTLGSAARNLAPRLGFSWDPRGKGRSKVAVSAGRYFDMVPMQAVNRSFSPRIVSTKLFTTQTWTSPLPFVGELINRGICAANSPKDTPSSIQVTCFDFENGPEDPRTHDPYGNLKPYSTMDGGSLYRAPIDKDLKGSFTDEWTMGYDWEFADSWTLGLLVINRQLRNAIEDFSLDYGKNYIIGNPGGPYRFHIDPENPDMVAFAKQVGCTTGAECRLTNADLVRAGFDAIPQATRKYRGYQLELRGQSKARFWFALSYVHSKTEGNYRGRYFVETEERDPNMTEAFDVPALNVNSVGLLPQDRTHQLKVYGNWRVKPDLGLGATFRFLSGTPFNATTDPAGGSTPFFGPLLMLRRGSAGRTPSLKNLDLSLAYDINDNGKSKVTLFLDVFNALNEQNAISVEEQFLAAGAWGKTTRGRGEPALDYLDRVFGNGDGLVSNKEWNDWAKTFEGRFQSIQELYTNLRETTYTTTVGGQSVLAPAYPGFANPLLCPASYSDALQKGCPGLNKGFGETKLLETPRAIRFGIRYAF